MTQDEAFDILAMGHNVFLTGAAGTGKTFLINRFIRHAREHAIMVAITASTGIAATHIGGMTIHSWSGMGIRDILSQDDIDMIISREYIAKRFAKTQVLIIDEISMLSGGFLDSLDRLLQSARFSPEPFGWIQVVLVGDFFQLPPVTRGSSIEFAFEHPAWRSFRLATCVLHDQYRQIQDPLLDILSEIRTGDISPTSRKLLDSRNKKVTTEDHTELFTKNIAVDAYNKEKIDAIGGDIFVFEMQSKWAEKLVESLKKWCLAPEMLVLKKWARVMFVKNNFEGGYVNGSIGHITGKFEWLPIIELLDGSQVIADYASWAIEENGKVKAEIAQVPLRLAWAITVHKSQWMTLDTAVMDLSDAFVPGQGYVALSRVRSLEGLILKWYNSTALAIDPRVREYDEILRLTSLKTSERLAQISSREKITKTEEAIRKLWGVIQKLDLDTTGPKKEKLATHEETFLLIKAGKTLEDIVEIRWLKLSTIFSHLEKLLEEGKEIGEHLLDFENPDDLAPIQDAFLALQTWSLSWVREYLAESGSVQYDYDTLRTARIILQMRGVKVEW